jgi:hypothetical protein
LLVELLTPQAGERLLDVGTGSGGLALTIMPHDSRASALWSLVREYRSSGDHSGAWRAELLESWFDVEVRERKSPPRERFGLVREVLDELDDAERRALRESFLELARRYEDQPLRSTVIVGRRR